MLERKGEGVNGTVKKHSKGFLFSVTNISSKHNLSGLSVARRKDITQHGHGHISGIINRPTTVFTETNGIH